MVDETHDDDLESMLLKYGTLVTFSKKISDDEDEKLWMSYTAHLPPKDSYVFGPDKQRYRVRGIRSDILSHPVNQGRNVTHTTVLLFPDDGDQSSV